MNPNKARLCKVKSPEFKGKCYRSNERNCYAICKRDSFQFERCERFGCYHKKEMRSRGRPPGAPSGTDLEGSFYT